MKSSGVFFTALLFLLLACTKGLAEEYTFKYGESVPHAPRASKVFGLGVHDRFFYGFDYSLQADILSIPSNPNPASFVLSPGLGVSVQGQSAFARAIWGPSYLSQPDQELGGHFQFMQDLTFGVQDYYNSIGLGYKHISSAGIEKPNRGKDYFYIILGVKF